MTDEEQRFLQDWFKAFHACVGEDPAVGELVLTRDLELTLYHDGYTPSQLSRLTRLIASY